MQENEKKQTEREKEVLLTEVLNSCMEEQLSFIPPEREIARMHTFSEEFQAYMKQLLRTKGKPERRQMTKREFVFRFNKMAAGLLILFVAGGLCAGSLMLLGRNGAKSETPAAGTESAAAYDMEVSESTEMTEEAAEEEMPDFGVSEKPEEHAEGEAPEEVIFMGNTIHLAAAQYLPEETESVRTLVSSPLVDREAESVKVTIGNRSSYPIYYYTSMDLEVWIDGAWYLIPGRQELTEEELNRMVKLEPEMAQDEEIFLEYYDLDYEAEKYRVVTYLDGLILSSEFRFENPESDLEEALDSAEE